MKSEGLDLQVKIHPSSVNCQLDAPHVPRGEPRPCPIMIFEEVRVSLYLRNLLALILSSMQSLLHCMSPIPPPV